MKIGRLLLRLSLGGFFVGHGTQKLFGWFGGYGLKGTADAFESMGLRPGRVHATAAGLAEAGGGAAVALGYRTPLATSALIATMLTAIKRVHLKNGPWITDGGYEYNAVLIVAALTLAELGPGPLSIDAIRRRQRSGARWALLALTLGAAGAAGANAFADAQKVPPAPVPAPEASESDPTTAEAPAAAMPVASAPSADAPSADAPSVAAASADAASSDVAPADPAPVDGAGEPVASAD
jgi:putative oxidoreductase